MDTTTTATIDCACVIHGTTYPWTYVERLYNMLNRHLSTGIRFHVYTEASRPVPAHMIKHELEDFGIGGPRRGWWYKLQLFNSAHHSGPMLYFDLDTVIVANIDWIHCLSTRHFWSVQDFKYLWRSTHQSVNSSVMWWDTRQYEHVWNSFKSQNINTVIKRHRGDQDFINAIIEESNKRYFDPRRVQSWRWQCLDGGFDFANNCHRLPNSGTQLSADTSVLIFHGRPKPDQVSDPVIQQHWQ